MNYIDPKPVFHTIDSTGQHLLEDGTSFNEAGYSFNQAGWAFGGLYGNDGKPAILDTIKDPSPVWGEL